MTSSSEPDFKKNDEQHLKLSCLFDPSLKRPWWRDIKKERQGPFFVLAVDHNIIIVFPHFVT